MAKLQIDKNKYIQFHNLSEPEIKIFKDRIGQQSKSFNARGSLGDPDQIRKLNSAPSPTMPRTQGPIPHRGLHCLAAVFHQVWRILDIKFLSMINLGSTL
jgi:hypothetical protein